MACPFVPVSVPMQRTLSDHKKTQSEWTSSLDSLSESPDSTFRNSWVRRGPARTYYHQDPELPMRMNGEEYDNCLASDALSHDSEERPPVLTLLGYEIMEERAKFTAYKILVRRVPNESWVIFRRYTDFSRLHDKLKEVFPRFRLSLPPKRWFRDNYDVEFLEERQFGLQAFLHSLMAHTDITDSEAVRRFLCLDDPPGPFDSLEESRAFCETLEETNHRLQRELGDKQREIVSLRKVLEDRELQIGILQKTLKCEIQLPKRSYAACWCGPATHSHPSNHISVSKVVEDKV
ncbi:sorting nexin-16 [Chanos chanos]|uniref:Sorting nexin-16 n=1 Tax=Chanos chanos TaxID=29144 RepID=A0A6J2VFM0_CHACN|nr:sorting nexin-16-like [Chanos chanos]